MFRIYCLLIEDDMFEFCYKVSFVLFKGWELYGVFLIVFDVVCGVMCCVQVVIKEIEIDYYFDMKLGQ